MKQRAKNFESPKGITIEKLYIYYNIIVGSLIRRIIINGSEKMFQLLLPSMMPETVNSRRRPITGFNVSRELCFPGGARCDEGTLGRVPGLVARVNNKARRERCLKKTVLE